jgi:hypothetical protein
MHASDVAPFVGVAGLSVALLAGAVQLQAGRERRYPGPTDYEDALYVRSGTAVRRLTGPFRVLAADMYWVRAIQYFGGTKRRLAAETAIPAAPPLIATDGSNAYADLYSLLDITTSLDPRFNIAYRFGAVFLAESYPSGPGRPDLAIKLLEKGLGERPDKWEYMQDIGFVHYWYLHDYRAAASWFDKAAHVSGAPWWLRSLAAVTLAQGGDRRSSRLMWEAIRQSPEIDWLRKDADRRLMQLRALDDIDALQRSVDQVTAHLGRAPGDWAAMVRARAVPGVPVDPSGTPYELTPDGSVRLSQSSPLWPPPAEPAQLQTLPPPS